MECILANEWYNSINLKHFQDGCFTKVFSIHSVYFWDNLPKTISEIYRVLKPEGTIILTLCAGKKGETWTDINNMLEQQVIPILGQNGFKSEYYGLKRATIPVIIEPRLR